MTIITIIDTLLVREACKKIASRDHRRPRVKVSGSGGEDGHSPPPLGRFGFQLLLGGVVCVGVVEG